MSNVRHGNTNTVRSKAIAFSEANAPAALLSSHSGSPSERADAFEEHLIRQLDEVWIAKSILYTSGDLDPSTVPSKTPPPGARALMGDDPRLKKMSDAPTLAEFFEKRLMSKAHLLQSAKLALDSGHDEKIVLACLLHDIAVCGLIRADHGYWGEQLIAPYVSEEISWAVRTHQALRFFPDESVGYEYPESYVRWFGEDYELEPYIHEEYRQARKHRWYMTARLITLNDLYAFDPTVEVSIDIFTDIIGRHFKQPREGLGFDGSPSAHMWRTMIRPTKFL
jgi:hypothetical protein